MTRVSGMNMTEREFFLAPEHNNVARRQERFVLAADAADAELVRQRLRGMFSGLVERSQHDGAVTPVHDSTMAAIV